MLVLLLLFQLLRVLPLLVLLALCAAASICAAKLIELLCRVYIAPVLIGSLVMSWTLLMEHTTSDATMPSLWASVIYAIANK